MAVSGRASYPCSRPADLDVASYVMEDRCHSWSVSLHERPSRLRSRDNNPLIYRLLPSWICLGMVTRRSRPRRNVTPKEKFISLTCRLGSGPPKQTSIFVEKSLQDSATAGWECTTWFTEPPSDTRHGLATPFERSSPCRALTRPRYGHRASRRSVWQWQDQDPCRP